MADLFRYCVGVSIAALVAAGAWIGSSQLSRGETPKSTSPPPKSQAVDANGFVDLLADRELRGWVVEMDGKTPDGKPNWKMNGDVLVCRGHGYGFLRYDQSLCDFVLRAEYRLTEKGNSGIGVRGVPYRGKAPTRPSFASYEIQLLDDHGKMPTTNSTGSLYRYVPPLAMPAKKAGEWNELEIKCEGPRIRVELNGMEVQNLDQRDVPKLAGKPLCGYVMLQCHETPVEFRGVRLKELPASNKNKDR